MWPVQCVLFQGRVYLEPPANDCDFPYSNSADESPYCSIFFIS